MTGPTAIRVLIVDDHAVVREGLVAQIAAEADMLVVGTAADAAAGLVEARAKHPQVVLMDIDMPGPNVFRVAAEIATTLPETRVVFLSAFQHDTYIDQALKARAWGYVTKGQSFTVLRQAIREVAHGWVYYSPEVRARLTSSPTGLRLATPPESRLATLSPRELEVLRHLARGLSTKEIAALMRLSGKTVENHKSRLMAKLGLHDRVELARFAIREGLVTP